MAEQPLQVFYASRPYRAFRMGLILSRGNKCQMCGKIISRSIDIICHHEMPLTIGNYKDATISLNPEKAKIICFDCHNKVEQRFGYVPVKQVTLIYGAPMSGKTTLVKQLMRRGDILVDINTIYKAISGLTEYDKPNSLYSNAVAVQNLLIDQIKTRYGKWNNAFIVGAYADKYKRDKIITDTGAEPIFCEATQEECVSRLYSDSDRTGIIEEYKGYISKWFEQYRE